MPSSNYQRRIGSATIALGLAALLGACAAHPAAAPLRAAQAPRAKTADASLYPTTPGLRWDYVLRQKQNDGSIKERPMAMGIARAAVGADGVTEAVLERRYADWSPPSTRIRIEPGAVVLSRLSDPVGGPSLTILRLPAAAGDHWPGRPLTGGNAERVVVRGEEAVTVPAGTYTALHVDHEITYASGDTDMLEYWYAPGAGMVRMIERTTLQMGGQTMKLAVEGAMTKLTPDAWQPIGSGTDAPTVGLLPQRIR